MRSNLFMRTSCIVEAPCYGSGPTAAAAHLPTGLVRQAIATTSRNACGKEKGRSPGPFCRRDFSLRIQDAQLERLADRLRAVHHVEFAQDLLHVVLHRERADLEDGADLEVRLAEVEPLEDVELAHREHAAAGGLVAAGVDALGELRAHPRRVQRRREQ